MQPRPAFLDFYHQLTTKWLRNLTPSLFRWRKWSLSSIRPCRPSTLTLLEREVERESPVLICSHQNSKISRFRFYHLIPKIRIA